jgi:hypothetical protein
MRVPGRGRIPTTDQSYGVRLPAAGRKGPAPPWPLEVQSGAEERLWARLWTTPQAVMWERSAWVDVVARYCRVAVEAVGSGFRFRRHPGARDEEEEEVLVEDRAVAIARTEARQLESQLGLSPLAMLRLRWVVVDEAGEQVGDDAGGPVDVRRRLEVM